MDMGTAIATSSAILGVVAIIFRIFPQNKNKTTHCEDHSGICTAIDGLDAWLNKIEAKLDRVIEGR